MCTALATLVALSRVFLLIFIAQSAKRTVGQIENSVNGTIQLTHQQWLYAAFKSQSLLTLNVPISEVGLCGSWHSGNAPIYHPLRYEAFFHRTSTDIEQRFCGSNGACTLVKGTYRLADQVGGIEWQLNLGIRRFHFELHQVLGLNPSIRICKAENDLCGQIKFSLYRMGVYSFESADDPCWSLVGLKSSDATIGCDKYSLSWNAALEKLSAFLDKNLDEIVFVHIVSKALVSKIGSCSSDNGLEGPIAGKLGSSVFRPNDLASYRNQQDDMYTEGPDGIAIGSDFATKWPSANYLRSVGKRIIFASDCTFSGHWIHDTIPQSQTNLPYVAEVASVKDFNAIRCAYETRNGLASLSNHFSGVYEDRSFLSVKAIRPDLNSEQSISNGQARPEDLELTTSKSAAVLNCGFSPLISHVNLERMSECVWTWAKGHSSLCGDNLCTAMHVNSTPSGNVVIEWINIDCSSSLPLACKYRSVCKHALNVR
jgi:hypothetical protein